MRIKYNKKKSKKSFGSVKKIKKEKTLVVFICSQDTKIIRSLEKKKKKFY
jgi:hypothetical protein